MSRQVEERVVSMEFDNAQFERRTKDTLSTLEKLKKSLKFEGAEKGFENVESAAAKVNMKGLADSVDTVSKSFSALDVVGVTALVNLTNEAVNAGKRMVKALSIDNVTSGWNKYGEKTRSVGTLKAQGFAMEEINRELDKLNWFTDETSYDLQTMVESLAKFTATGKGLKESSDAMQGIALWAALSGQNAQKASSAMYQLSQALGAGVMRKEDYKSIQNLSMDTDEFRQIALDAGVALGTLQKNADGTYMSLANANGTFTKSQFAEHLTEDAWFTSDVMMDVYKKYTTAIDQIYDYTEEHGVTASQAIKEMGDSLDAFGLKAFKAGQEARTFGDAIDATKDAASSAWSNVFQTIFGDYDEAVELWTNLANSLYDIFVEPINQFQAMLAKGLDNPFGDFLLDTVETTEVLTSTLQDLSSVVNDVIRGDYGNDMDRVERLTAAGYDYAAVQNRVNELLGSSVRLEEKQAAALGKTEKAVHRTFEELVGMSNVQLAANGYSVDFIASLRQVEQAANDAGIPISELNDGFDKLSGRALIVDGLSRISEAIQSILQTVKDAWAEAFPPKNENRLYKAISAFHKFTTRLKPSEATLKRLSSVFGILFNTIGLVTDVVKKLAGYVRGALTTGFTLFGKAIAPLNINLDGILEKFLAWVKAAREWVQDGNNLSTVFEQIKIWVIAAKDAIAEFLDKITAGKFGAFGDTVAAAAENVWTFFQNLLTGQASLKDLDFSPLTKKWEKVRQFFSDAPRYILQGLAKAFTGNGILANIIQSVTTIFTNIITTAKDILEIHSPSKVFYWIGSMIVAGLIGGILGGQAELSDATRALIGCITRILDEIDVNKLMTIGGVIATFALTNQAIKAIDTLASNMKTLVSPLAAVEKLIGSFTSAVSGIQKAMQKKLLAEALKSFATSILILSAAVWVMAKVDPAAVWRASGIIAGLMILLGGFTYLLSLVKPEAVAKVSGTLLAFAGSIAIIAIAMRMIAGIDADKIGRTLGAIVILLGCLAGIMALYAFIGVKAAAAGGMATGDVGTVILKMAASLVVMAYAMKVLSGIESEKLGHITGALAVFFAGMVGVMLALGKVNDVPSELSNFMLKIAGAFLIMAVSLKIIDGLGDDVWRSVLVITALAGLVTLLGWLFGSKITGLSSGVDTASLVLIKMGAAMMLMAGAMRIIAGIDDRGIAVGFTVITGMSVILGGFVGLAKLDLGQSVDKVGRMFLGLGVAMIAIALAMKIISTMTLSDIVFAGAVVGGLIVMCGLFALLVKVGNGTLENVGKTLMGLGVALLLMSASIAILSFVEPDKVLIGVMALGVLIEAVSLLMLACSTLKVDASGAIIKVAILVGVLAASLVALTLIDQSKLLPAVKALSATLLVLAVAIRIMAGMKNITKDALLVLPIMLGLLIGVTGAFLALSLLGVDGNTALKYTVALSTLMLAMSGAIAICAKIGPTAVSALPAIGIIALVITGMVGLAALIGSIVDPAAVASGMDSLVALTEGLGRAIGGFIGGIGEGLITSLTNAGDAIKAFIQNVTSAGDADTLAAVTGIVGAIVSLKKLKNLDLDSEALKTQLVNFAEGVKAFSDALSEGDIDEAKVNAAAQAGIAIASVIEALPKEGGLWQKVVGESGDLGKFAMDMGLLGAGIVAFVNATKEVEADSADNAVAAAKVVASLYDALPKDGGWVQAITGHHMSYATFSADMMSLGLGIVAFSNAVSGDKVNSESIEAAANAAKVVAALYEQMVPIGGVVQFFEGTTTTLDSFGDQMEGLGEGLKSFADSTDGITAESVSGAVEACKLCSDMMKYLPEGDSFWDKLTGLFGGKTDPLDGFGDKMSALGEVLKTFSESMEQVDTAKLNTAIKKVSSTLEMLDTLNTVSSGEGVTSLATMAESLGTLAKTDISTVVSTMVDTISEYYPEFTSAGETAMTKFIEGIQNKAAAVTAKAEEVAKAFINRMDDYSAGKGSGARSLYSIGQSFASSLISGINSKKSEVYEAAKALAQAAAEGASSVDISVGGITPVYDSNSSYGYGSILDTGSLSNAYSAGKGLYDRVKGGVSSTTNTNTTNNYFDGLKIQSNPRLDDTLSTLSEQLTRNQRW